MSDEVVCLNGTIVPAADAKLSVTDRGLTHGCGYFETMRVHNGKVFHLADHMARLRTACASSGIAFPVRDEMVAEKAAEMSRVIGLPSARARLTVTAGDGSGPWFKSSHPNWFIAMTKLVLPPEQFYDNGVPVGTTVSHFYRPGASQPGKSLSYERHVFTRRSAVEKKLFELIYVSESGEFFEGAGANFFAVIRRRIVTPPVSVGVVPGVARKTAIELATGKLKYKVEEMPVHKMDLKNAEEAFLTNAIIGVMPVRSIDGEEPFEKVPGDVTRLVMRNYRAAIVDECGEIQP